MELFEKQKVHGKGFPIKGTTKLPEDLCREYSEYPSELDKLLNEIEVFVTFMGKKKFFNEDDKQRLFSEVEIKRSDKSIVFEFWHSLNDTEIFFEKYYGLSSQKKILIAKRKFRAGLLYSILSSVSYDFFIPDSFHEFCAEFGYDEDSIKAENLHRHCVEHSRILHKIFTEKEIECLPR